MQSANAALIISGPLGNLTVSSVGCERSQKPEQMSSQEEVSALTGFGTLLQAVTVRFSWSQCTSISSKFQPAAGQVGEVLTR